MLSSYYKSSEDIEKDRTALSKVKSSLSCVTEGLVRNALLSNIQDDYQALIESKKENAVESVYKKINKLIEESGFDIAGFSNGNYDYDTFGSFYASETDRSISYKVNTDGFDFHGYESYAPDSTFSYYPDYPDGLIHYSELYDDIEKEYNSFIVEQADELSYLYDMYYDYSGISFCVLKDGEVQNQNVTDITEQNITENQYYPIVKNGEITASENFDSSVLPFISEQAMLPENENYTLYLYINNTDGANYYTFTRNLYSAVQQVNAKFYPLLFADIICIIASFCSCVLLFQHNR